MNNVIDKTIKDGVLNSYFSEELILSMVNEVIESLKSGEEFEAKTVADRIKLIKGDQVVFEKFDTGKEGDKVTFKEILTIEESPNMATGFLRIENSSFDWYLGYDELDYIIEGTLEITYDGKTYRGYPGDVIYIPKNTPVTFSSPNDCRFFFAAAPANWQDLCEEE